MELATILWFIVGVLIGYVACTTFHLNGKTM